MPITQERMLSVLAEAAAVEEASRTLREDFSRVLNDPKMSDGQKVMVLSVLVTTSQAPLCPQTLIERDHFRRAQRRNERNAEKMRRRRATGGGSREPSETESARAQGQMELMERES